MLKHTFKRSINRNGLILFELVGLAFSFSVMVTVSHHSIDFVVAQKQQQNVIKTGMFNYTQIGPSGNSDWINTGNWSLTESPTVVLNFDAVINMVKPDGSEAHEYMVNDLVISYAPLNRSNSNVIIGTTTITMNDDGLYFSKVPTTITSNEKNISVYFDTSKIGTHFGNQSITGSVTSSNMSYTTK